VTLGTSFEHLVVLEEKSFKEKSLRRTDAATSQKFLMAFGQPN